jgi:hypothetical protein
MRKYIDQQGLEINLDSAKNCLTALHDKALNYDSSELVQEFNADNEAKGIFTLALTYQLPEVVRRTRPSADSDVLIPTRYYDWIGFESIQTTYLESAGQVTRGRGDDDVNYMDIKYRQEPTTFVENQLGIYVSRQTMETNLRILQSNYYQGLNLVTDIQIETENQFSEDYHLLGMFGDSSHNVYGLFNHPDTPENIVTNFYPYDPATTRAQNYNWLLNLLDVALQGTKYYGKFNSLLIPQEYALQLMKIDSYTNVETTAWDLLKKNFQSMGITNIAYLPELNKNSLIERGLFNAGDNQALIKFYNRDPSCLERYSTTHRVINKTPMNLEYKAIIEQRVSTLNYKKPLESLIIQFPTGVAP